MLRLFEGAPSVVGGLRGPRKDESKGGREEEKEKEKGGEREEVSRLSA